MLCFGSIYNRLLRPLAGIAVLAIPALANAESSSHVAMNHQLPAWAEQLKGQTIVEDAMSGRADRSAKVEQQHQRIMDHMSKDPQVQAVNTGMYNTSAMMHQYGAGGQDLLLMSDPRVEPVGATGGREVSGCCPRETV